MKQIILCVAALILAILLSSCRLPLLMQSESENTAEITQIDSEPAAKNLVVTAGMSIGSRFNPPQGFERIKAPMGSFEGFLQELKLKPDGSPVLTYSGEEKTAQVHAAVVDMEIGDRDLQQCADAAIRLRGEYLYHAGMLDQISFRFTNGFQADYRKWRSGQRINVKGNLVQWTTGGKASDDYQTFRKYLDMVFSYAGTLSLSNELKSGSLENLKGGDVFIHGGSPGHCVIVVDVAENGDGEKRFLLAQSYMPAQEIHILKNPHNPDGDPWYSPDDSPQIVTPQWTFEWSELKSW